MGPPPNDGGSTDKPGPAHGIAINELMAKNGSSITDTAGGHADWVELHNLGDTAKDLSGFLFSDDLTVPDKMSFPDGTTLPAGGFFVFFVDGDGSESTPAEPHAPFKLSGNGEVVLLSDASGKRLDGYAFPALLVDVSYGRLPDGSGEPQILDVATPRGPNDGDPVDAGQQPDAGCIAPFPDGPPAIVINEVFGIDPVGPADCAPGFGWIELYNNGDAPEPLDGLTLADDQGSWLLPDQSLGSHAFLLICGDENPGPERPLHSSLQISFGDKAVTLGDRCGTVFQQLCNADPDGVCQDIGTVAGQSLGLQPDGNTSVAPVALTPTPNVSNGG